MEMTTRDTAARLVYVGTYTDSLPHVQAKASGIDIYRLDMDSGALTYLSTCAGIANPSYLVLDAQGRHLYGVEETAEGQVHAFSVDPSTGTLTPLNHHPSHGAEPCHLSLDRQGRWVLVANYSSGSIAVLPIQEDGSLGPATERVQHQGGSANPDRQQGPHAHWIYTDPANRFVLAVDLGQDAVVRYELDAERGTLRRTDAPACATPPGSGPRHLAFSPDGRFAYLLNELSSTLIAHAYDASSGELRPLQDLSTLPTGFDGINWTSALRVSPSGRFVYASNRGHDSIAIFASDPATGHLSLVGHEPTQGGTPRDFNIDPTGTFLLAANQDDDSIVTFRIDGETGRLSPAGQVAEARTPVCIAFGPPL
jgi:6-phosphogluconolactonase